MDDARERKIGPLFRDPRQERIHRRLTLIGPGPSASYRDMCRLMGGGVELETMAHLVAHLARETESALRDVLLPKDYQHPEPCPTCRRPHGGHKQEVEAILRSYGFQPMDDVWKAWLDLIAADETKLHKLAHRNALWAPRQKGEDIQRAWDLVETILDLVLERFEKRFLESIGALDELLAKAMPTIEDARQLRTRIPNNETTLAYFFDRAQNPEWLALLAKIGFFQHPPEPVREEGGTRFPAWPESRYLARMAKDTGLQERIAEIALEIAETEHIGVNEDLADIALAVPPALAVKFVSKARRWMESPYQRLLAEKLGALISHLARGGQVEGALEVAQMLLMPVPDPRPAQGGRSYERRLPPEPRARMDLWTYDQILKRNLPDLVEVAGKQAVEVLCKVLAEALEFSRHGEEGDPRADYSYIWRPAVEEHEQNPAYEDLKDSLVTAIRNAVEQIAEKRPESVPGLVEMLEGHRWQVFHRLALHLLRLFPGVAPGLVVERLTDQKRFDEPCLWHEYVLLARERFAHLGASDQAKILGWIEKGPDTERFRVWREKETGKPLTVEQINGYVRYWQMERLASLREVLPPDWKKRWGELVAELGEPEHPEFRSYHSEGWVGPTTPKGADELRALNVEEMVDYLRTWEPPADFMGHSREGLGREVTAIVASDPTRFAPEANRFRELHPTYVRAFLQGMREAVNAGRTLSWDAVLDLCRWVLEQGPDIPEKWKASPKADEEDPGWGWTRKAIADLLEHGFQRKEAGIPIGLRRDAWAVLEPLTDDLDPTQDYEAKYGGRNMDPATLSINTTRGQAMHAVVAYGLWIRRNLEREPNVSERVGRGFEEMPEVREVLDRHLDPTRDPSLAIRSVYGRWLPWLAHLDRAWTESRLRQIFPEEDPHAVFRDVAWEAYITFCQPFNDMIEILKGEYKKAVKRIGMGTLETRHLADPEERLAEHLISFYLRGKLSLEEPNGILADFYSRASVELRAHAIEFIGRALYEDRKAGREVSGNILLRMKTLWDRRFEASSTDEPRELIPFGLWFASGRFDDDWATPQLLQALKVVGRTKLDFLVMERLAEVAPERPLQAVQCARLMVEGAREVWEISGWRGHIRAILGTALRGSDSGARQAAVELVHLLGARGHLEFRDLLGDDPSGS